MHLLINSMTSLSMSSVKKKLGDIKDALSKEIDQLTELEMHIMEMEGEVEEENPDLKVLYERRISVLKDKVHKIGHRLEQL